MEVKDNEDLTVELYDVLLSMVDDKSARRLTKFMKMHLPQEYKRHQLSKEIFDKCNFDFVSDYISLKFDERRRSSRS